MEVTFFQKNLNKKEEGSFVEYVNQKIPSVEQLITKFSPDGVLLKVSIEKFNKHDAFQVELCLVLPTKSLVATEASHQISKAVDLSKDRLLAQIKKHMATSRKHRAHRSIREEVRVLNALEVSEEILQ